MTAAQEGIRTHVSFDTLHMSVSSLTLTLFYQHCKI